MPLAVINILRKPKPMIDANADIVIVLVSINTTLYYFLFYIRDMSHDGYNSYPVVYFYNDSWLDRAIKIVSELERLAREYVRLATLRASILGGW
jgi:hypothetical protein